MDCQGPLGWEAPNSSNARWTKQTFLPPNAEHVQEMITKCYYPFAYERLTLILPGEVKVDLANFDVKFWTKFLNIGFLCNFPIPAELYSKFF